MSGLQVRNRKSYCVVILFYFQGWEGPQVSGKDFSDLGGEECVS